MQLVIVESPAKAKTINKYLGSDYKVIASYGHIRDLPSKDGSVLPDEDFRTIYEISEGSERNVKAMVDAAKKADSIILATDPDREGEAISWHVLEALKEKRALGKNTKISRVVFNAITKRAVLEAMENPRAIDMNLVDAQQARRVLDYLVGFNLSPILWRKLPGSRSAGRVQSVALRLICEREAEIEVFKSQEYWDIKVDFLKSTTKFSSHLTHVKGEKLGKFSLNNEKDAKAVAAELEKKKYRVLEVEKKQVKRNPYAPFTTSTLQQEAFRKLGFGAKKTMMLAQKLYEGIDIGSETVGLITYMRTDGVQVAMEAITASRELIAKKFGKECVPASPRLYTAKAKNAQEAHEAIRPTEVSREPGQVSKYLEADMLKLYDLIWKRMVASQMESAILDQVTVDIETEDKYAILRATGSTVKFPSFFLLYREQKDDEKDDDEEMKLPPLEKGEALEQKGVFPAQHFTEPPPRYSEASLVKKLEELGIGRPSTYASIIAVLQDREYVRLDKKRFIPEERGRLVTSFLQNFFERYVQYDFTANLEEQLDEISAGEVGWKKVLADFWKDFTANIDATKKLDIPHVLEKLDHDLERHIFGEPLAGVDPRKCPNCADGRLGLKISRYGAFIGCSNYPECNYTRKLVSTVEGEAPMETTKEEPVPLGKDAEGNEITLRKGPYGYYVQLGEAVTKGKKKEKPKRASLPKGFEPASLTLEKALGLLSLPREIGKHPESGKMIKASIGRFGPYIEHDGKYKSLPAGDDVLEIGINRAVALLAEKSEGKGRASVAPLKILGSHPDSGDIAVYSGRYGPYVKWGKINATIPKGTEPEEITLEEAVKLITARAEKGPVVKAKRGGRKKG